MNFHCGDDAQYFDAIVHDDAFGVYHCGSMNTGYCVPSPDSTSLSGVSTSSLPPDGTSTPTVASLPDSVAPGSVAATAAAFAEAPERAAFPAPSASVPGPGEESHICGVGASNTALPAPSSTASRPPCAVSLTAIPSAASSSRNDFSSGFAAASALFTTSNCVKPSTCAPIRRSTPGNTSAYVAVSPDTTGLGNADGHDSANSRPARSIRTSG